MIYSCIYVYLYIYIYYIIVFIKQKNKLYYIHIIWWLLCLGFVMWMDYQEKKCSALVKLFFPLSCLVFWSPHVSGFWLFFVLFRVCLFVYFCVWFVLLFLLLSAWVITDEYWFDWVWSYQKFQNTGIKTYPSCLWFVGQEI